jgi:hypothetical protein
MLATVVASWKDIFFFVAFVVIVYCIVHFTDIV